MPAPEDIYVTNSLKVWKTTVDRVSKVVLGLSGEELNKEVAPGRNRLVYLLGHLTATHDAMLSLLAAGARLHPELDVLFLSSPDKHDSNLPTADQLKAYWTEVNQALEAAFATFSPADWLQRHTSVSPEDFEKDPLRNRYSILLSRTSHLAYHFGQIVLATK